MTSQTRNIVTQIRPSVSSSKISHTIGVRRLMFKALNIFGLFLFLIRFASRFKNWQNMFFFSRDTVPLLKKKNKRVKNVKPSLHAPMFWSDSEPVRNNGVYYFSWNRVPERNLDPRTSGDEDDQKLLGSAQLIITITVPLMASDFLSKMTSAVPSERPDLS